MDVFSYNQAMIKILHLVIIFLLFTNCTDNPNTRLVTGDLYYTWLRFGSFYGQPDSVFHAYEEGGDIGWYSELYKSDSIGAAYVQMLDKQNLLQSPFIYLRTDQDSTCLIFLEESDYRQFTKFNYRELTENEQKVRIEAIVEPIWDRTFLCHTLNSVELTDGITLQKQRKFKIEDYR